MRVQSAEYAIEDFRVGCAWDGRGGRRCRRTVPGTGVAVVNNRRPCAAPIGTAASSARDACKDRLEVGPELAVSWS